MGTVYALDINEGTFLPAKFKDLASLLNILFPLLFIGGALLFLAMLCLGAFRWVTAGDNAEVVKKAQSTLSFSVIGLALIFISYLAVKLIGVVLNISSAIPF